MLHLIRFTADCAIIAVSHGRPACNEFLKLGRHIHTPHTFRMVRSVSRWHYLSAIIFLGGILPGVAYAHAEENEIVIHMSDTEYAPRNLVIQPGQTVIFENASTRELWPASN